jgi:hypothetical protein
MAYLDIYRRLSPLLALLVLPLLILLMIQKGETRHWKKQSGQFEQLYHNEQSALIGTVANYRAAADQARAADKANAERVAAEQRAINERTVNDYQARIADARARAQRLQAPRSAAADPGGSSGTPMPRLPATAAGAAEATCENGLSDALTATCQAIELDELITWVTKQHAVPPNDAQPPR